MSLTHDGPTLRQQLITDGVMAALSPCDFIQELVHASPLEFVAGRGWVYTGPEQYGTSEEDTSFNGSETNTLTVLVAFAFAFSHDKATGRNDLLDLGETYIARIEFAIMRDRTFGGRSTGARKVANDVMPAAVPGAGLVGLAVFEMQVPYTRSDVDPWGEQPPTDEAA